MTANEQAAIVRVLDGEPLRQVAAQLEDGDLTCFRLACTAFRAHSAPPKTRTRSAFVRSTSLVKYALEQLPGFSDTGIQGHGETVLSIAAGVGNVDVLEWLREAGHALDQRACSKAAQEGHLEVLRWLRERGCPWDKHTCASAARGGHLEVLRWAREHDCPWDKATCSSAAREGQLDALRWAREHGCPWDDVCRKRRPPPCATLGA